MSWMLLRCGAKYILTYQTTLIYLVAMVSALLKNFYFFDDKLSVMNPSGLRDSSEWMSLKTWNDELI